MSYIVKKKKEFLRMSMGIKVQHGYSSDVTNVKSLVSMKYLKLDGLESHDCHELMYQLLPNEIRGILLKDF